jgi:SMI1 / KNR4 family (SUKH-1)
MSAMDRDLEWPFAGVDPTAPGAEPDEIEELERALGVVFPDDYRTFLRWSNGWAGWLGEEYIALSSTSDLPWANDEDSRRLYPGVVNVGGDGGLETFALDFRSGSDARGLVTFDRVAGLGSVRRLGPSFAAGIARLVREPNGPWDEDS